MASVCIIDVDNVLFEYKTILVNYLGTIANAIDDVLISPWTQEGDEEKITPRDAIIKSDSRLLREAIKAILRYSETPSGPQSFNFPEIVKETLCMLSDVLEKYNLVHSPTLQALSHVYNGATLYSLVAKGGTVHKEKVHEWDISQVGMLSGRLHDLLLLGWLKVSLENLCTEKQVDFEYFQGVSEGYTHGQVVFVTMFKEALETFVECGGFEFSKTFKNIITVHSIEDLNSVIEDPLKSFQIISKNLHFINDVAKTLNNTCTIKKIPRGPNNVCKRVDLNSTLDVAHLSGTLGSFLELREPICIEGTIIKGHGRGLLLLGIPTANLKCTHTIHLFTGIYYGRACIIGNVEVSESEYLDAIVSIGFNPHFMDTDYVIEVYLYKRFEGTLLDHNVKIYVEGFLRSDGKYQSLADLVKVVQTDLHMHKLIMNT